MSDHKREDEPSTSQAKRKRIDEREQPPNVMADEAPNQISIAAAPNDRSNGQRPQIFKLDVDCVQEILDYLSIRDINSVAETCTRMKRIVGDYFQPNLIAFFVSVIGERDLIDTNHFSYKGSLEFIPKLNLFSSSTDNDYRFIGLHCKSLKHLTFSGPILQLNADKSEYIKPILSKIESLEFIDCFTKDDFFERYLRYCPKLKHLSIQNFNKYTLIGANNEWLLRSYPTLERLKLRVDTEVPIAELSTFLERNQCMQKLSMDGHTFLLNIDAMLQAKIKLQVLEVDVNPRTAESVCRHLMALHDRGFYQRLHLIAKGHVVNQEQFGWFSALRGLELFELSGNLDTSLSLNSLSNLKILNVHGNFSNFHLKFSPSTAKCLVNLERLHIWNFGSDMIEPFIQFSVKLKAIKICRLNEKRKMIDLSVLNKKREQLVGASAVRIYVAEDVYLATKWGNKTDFKMVEVRRIESYDWN